MTSMFSIFVFLFNFLTYSYSFVMFFCYYRVVMAFALVVVTPSMILEIIWLYHCHCWNLTSITFLLDSMTLLQNSLQKRCTWGEPLLRSNSWVYSQMWNMYCCEPSTIQIKPKPGRCNFCWVHKYCTVGWSIGNDVMRLFPAAGLFVCLSCYWIQNFITLRLCLLLTYCTFVSVYPGRG